MEIEVIIGDYRQFARNLFNNTLKVGLHVKYHELDHICYRTSNLEEYNSIRTRLKPLSSEMATTVHNGREFSIFRLIHPLRINDLIIPLVELPAPAPDNTYASGLEHIEVVIRQDFSKFCNRYKNLFTHQPDMSTSNPAATITFKNKTTVKFHPISLDEAVILQGNKFESSI